MTTDQMLRFRLHCAVEPWAIEAPQEVQHAVSRFLAGLVLANSPQKIINEAEVVSELAAQLLDYLHFSVGALGAQDSN